MATLSHYQTAKEALGLLRLLAEDASTEGLRHPDQDQQAYWQSADLQVVPNESHERPDAFEQHQMVVFSRHAADVGWALFFVRDALRPYLSADNKSLVFGQIGLALRRAQAAADPARASPLLLAVIDAAEDVLEAAESAARRSRRRR
ncbi:MAG: hypothetical protein ACK5VI_01520 [Opitutia bacterium]|jgi:hypothetical protein